MFNKSICIFLILVIANAEMLNTIISTNKNKCSGESGAKLISELESRWC